MGWVILGFLVAVFVWLWIKASRSPRTGVDHAHKVETDQMAKHGPGSNSTF